MGVCTGKPQTLGEQAVPEIFRAELLHSLRLGISNMLKERMVSIFSTETVS